MTDAEGSWVYGIHAVRNTLDAAPGRVRRVWIVEGRRRNAAMGELLERARTANVRVETVARRALDRVAPGVHQGVAAQCDAVAPTGEGEFERRWSEFVNPFLLVLEGIQDPRNLGACLRTAEAAGVDAVLLPKHRTAPLTPTVAKAASGALERLLIVSVTNLARRLSWLAEQGVWIVGGYPDAPTSLFDLGRPGGPSGLPDVSSSVAVVLGGEGAGLRRLTRERCDHLVRIPMAGHVSSLNVSVAAALMMFEVARARA